MYIYVNCVCVYVYLDVKRADLFREKSVVE